MWCPSRGAANRTGVLVTARAHCKPRREAHWFGCSSCQCPAAPGAHSSLDFVYSSALLDLHQERSPSERGSLSAFRERFYVCAQSFEKRKSIFCKVMLVNLLHFFYFVNYQQVPSFTPEYGADNFQSSEQLYMRRCKVWTFYSLELFLRDHSVTAQRV